MVALAIVLFLAVLRVVNLRGGQAALLSKDLKNLKNFALPIMYCNTICKSNKFYEQLPSSAEQEDRIILGNIDRWTEGSGLSARRN